MILHEWASARAVALSAVLLPLVFQVCRRDKDLLGIVFHDPSNRCALRDDKRITLFVLVYGSVFFDYLDAAFHNITELEFRVVVLPAAGSAIPDPALEIAGAVLEIGPVIGVRFTGSGVHLFTGSL